MQGQRLIDSAVKIQLLICQHEFFQFKRLNVHAIFIDTHVSAGNFINQHNLSILLQTAKFQLDII